MKHKADTKGEKVIFRKLRTKIKNECIASIEIECLNEKPISIELKATKDDLRRLRDMAMNEPSWLGQAIADCMNSEEIVEGLMQRENFQCDFDEAVAQLDKAKRYKSKVSYKIKQSARWLYAIVEELRAREIPLEAWPAKIQSIHRNLEGTGLEDNQIDPFANPIGFVYFAVQEAYFDEAKEVGLTIFRHNDEDGEPGSFGPGYLYDKSPSRIRVHFLNRESTEELKHTIEEYMDFSFLKRLLPRL